MRAAVLGLAVALAGCQLFLGIEDPVGDECSPFDVETCDPDETCDLDPDEGRLTCRMEGTVQAGELCFELDDCAGPLSCADGVCRTFCPVFGEDCGDPAEGTCIRQWASSHLCDSSCRPEDPASSGCNADTECILSTNDSGTPISLCVPFGYFGDLPAGDPCEFLGSCVAGYACDDPEGDGGVCTQLCDVNNPVCAAGTCTARFETIHDGIQLGFCL